MTPRRDAKGLDIPPFSLRGFLFFEGAQWLRPALTQGCRLQLLICTTLAYVRSFAPRPRGQAVHVPLSLSFQ